MSIVLKNNVVGYLAYSVSAGDTVLRLRTNDGLKFPFLDAPNYFYATLSSATQGDIMEIVKVTYRMNDNLSVVRAQEDTTAVSFPIGAKVELRVTAKSITDAIGEVDVTSNVAAAQAAAQAAALSSASASAFADDAGSYAEAALTSSTNAATSFNNAQTSASQASTFANQASTSASNALGSESAANISAGTAAASSFSAGQSADIATGAAGNALTSAGNASTSAIQSSTSASNAAGSASAASISATAAAASSFTSSGAADNATNSATAAATSASQASTSATAAGSSAISANTSATNASTSAGNASTSAGNASTSASNASTSASQASTSASNAAGSASAASTSASNAANSSNTAGNSATSASGFASAASTSASNAATSATNAGISATASQGFSATAQGYRDDALTFRNTTEGYRDTTLGYRDTTLGYRNDALSYRNSAESFADAAEDFSVAADGFKAQAASSATLSANYAKQGGVSYIVSDFVAEGLFWTTAFGGSPTTVADPPSSVYTYVDVSGAGRVARVNFSSITDSYIQPKAVFTPVVGQKYRVRVTAKVHSNPTGGGIFTCGIYINGLTASFVHTDPSSDWTTSADGNRVSFNNSFDEADGVVNLGIIFTCTAVSANSAYWRPRFGMARSGGAGGVIEVRELLIEEITDIATTNATISTLQQTVSDGDGANALSISNLSASFGTGIAFGPNACSDSNFDNFATVWTNLYTQSGSLASVSVVTSTGLRFLRRQNTGMTVGHQSNLGVSSTYATPCAVGDRIELSAYVSFTNQSSCALIADWFNSSDAYITSSIVVNSMSNNARSGGFVTAPVGAVKVSLNVVGYCSSATNEYQITQPFLRKASSLQTALSPYERSVDPGTTASIISEASARAAADSAQATTTSILSAQVVGAASGGPAINTSPNFADNANATGIPTNWADWSNAGGNTTRSTGSAPQPYAVTINGTAGNQVGILQSLFGKMMPGWYVLEADAELISGTFAGAGVFIYSQMTAESDTSYVIDFDLEPDINGTVAGAGSTGKIYRWRKLVQLTHATPSAGFPYIYAVAHWTGTGDISVANSIKFHRAAVRAASQAEIEARQAKLDLVTANAAISSNQLAQADVNSAQATTNSTLSAQVVGAASGGPAINTSPNFADNANATGVPTNWANWTNGSGTRVTGIAPQPYAFTLDGGAGAQAGISQFRAGALTKGFYVLEADVTLNSGALTGAGVWFDWAVATVGAGTGLVFATDPDVTGSAVGAGTTGRLYRWRKLVEVPGVPDNVNMSIYAMSHWDGHGSVASANSITWHRCAIRPASQAEIEARQAKLDLVTTNANVATNTSAIATETSARAAADTTLSAKINVNGNRFPHPQPLSTTLPAGWVGTGLEVGTWQPLGGNFYYRPRSSGGSATTEYYYYDVEPTASAWVSTGEQYTLSAVGYGGAGTAGDRLLMWLEYYNSSNTMVYSSPQILLAAYAPPERYSTTAAYTSGGEYVRRRVVFAREWAASGSYQDAVFNYIKLERGPIATAYTADGALTPLQASVTTNASAIATVNGAAAFWETIVSAGGGDLSAVRLKAGSTGSYIELISTVLRLANVSNGAVIEVMRAISGEAFFSRPISSDSASRRLTIGPGYGVSGSEVVLWFGPVATAPSSQSRTNGYFALGTDGKIYFGSTDLAVLTTPMTATITGSVSTSHNASVTPTVNTTVSVTAVTNGTSPYTYQWALIGLDPGSVAPELTGVTASAVDVYRGATLAVNADYGVYLSCTITDANGKQCTKYWSYIDVSTAN